MPVENGKIYTWYVAQGHLQSVTYSDELYNLTMTRLAELRIEPTVIKY
ncbi:hypothetical protein WDV13_06020 [Weissella cibaria]|nr:hypothetical protein [Weissella cibaria]MCQ9619919.1 hypothetical protein [Weissella cibaria]